MELRQLRCFRVLGEELHLPQELESTQFGRLGVSHLVVEVRVALRIDTGHSPRSRLRAIAAAKTHADNHLLRVARSGAPKPVTATLLCGSLPIKGTADQSDSQAL